MLLIGRGRELLIFHVIFIRDKICKAGRGISFHLDITWDTFYGQWQIVVFFSNAKGILFISFSKEVEIMSYLRHNEFGVWTLGLVTY